MPALKMAQEGLDYLLYYSPKRRSIALQIAKGQLTVRAPAGIDIAQINALIAQKQAWIAKHLQQSLPSAKPNWLSEQQLPLLGRMVTFQLQQAAASSVIFSDNKIRVLLSKRLSPINVDAKIRQLLQLWYKQQAEVWFRQRVIYWQQQMQLASSAIVIGNWRSKWGHCKSTAELGFNWRLMMAPEWVADYVVVHELAHIRHLNHSAAFWHVVDEYYPRHDEARSWLKHHQYQLEL